MKNREADLLLREFVGNAILSKRSISQEQLAKRIGCARTTICNLEGGNQEITLSMLSRIAAALGVDIKELLP